MIITSLEHLVITMDIICAHIYIYSPYIFWLKSLAGQHQTFLKTPAIPQHRRVWVRERSPWVRLGANILLTLGPPWCWTVSFRGTLFKVGCPGVSFLSFFKLVVRGPAIGLSTLRVPWAQSRFYGVCAAELVLGV